MCWVQKSSQWVAICSFGFLGIGSCLLSGGITSVYHWPVVVFPSMKNASGEDSASMLGPCLLDTCRSGCSLKGQLHFVYWLLFEECSTFSELVLIPPPPRCLGQESVPGAKSKRRGLFGSRVAAR